MCVPRSQVSKWRSNKVWRYATGSSSQPGPRLKDGTDSPSQGGLQPAVKYAASAAVHKDNLAQRSNDSSSSRTPNAETPASLAGVGGNTDVCSNGRAPFGRGRFGLGGSAEDMESDPKISTALQPAYSSRTPSQGLGLSRIYLDILKFYSPPMMIQANSGRLRAFSTLSIRITPPRLPSDNFCDDPVRVGGHVEWA